MKRYEVERFMTTWPQRPPGDRLAQLCALAHRHGCRFQAWENPSGSWEKGWLCWLETPAVGAHERMLDLERELCNNPDLRALKNWFQSVGAVICNMP